MPWTRGNRVISSRSAVETASASQPKGGGGQVRRKHGRFSRITVRGCICLRATGLYSCPWRMTAGRAGAGEWASAIDRARH